MPKFTVHTNSETITIDAEYYQHDEGWITFKGTDNKPVADIRESHALRIERVFENDNKRTVTVTLKADTSEYMKAIEEAVEAVKKLKATI